MKHRNIIAVVIFSIITLGIYDLYWLVKTKKVLNQATKIHTPTIWLLFLPIVILVALAIASVALIGYSSTAAVNGTMIIIELLAVLLIVPISFYWFFKFSKAVNEYTHGEMSTAMTFILLWILRFIGLAVIQDKFNDMLAVDTTSATPVLPQHSNPVYPPTILPEQESSSPTPPNWQTPPPNPQSETPTPSLVLPPSTGNQQPVDPAPYNQPPINPVQ